LRCVHMLHSGAGICGRPGSAAQPTPAALVSSLPQTGEVSAAAGAGIYFEERRGLLTSLWLLLQAQVQGGEP